MSVTTGTIHSIGTLGWHTSAALLGDAFSVGTLGWHVSVATSATSGPSSDLIPSRVNCDGRDPVKIRRSVMQLDQRLIDRCVVRAETGDPEKGRDGQFCLNLEDGTIKICADGYWRLIGSF